MKKFLTSVFALLLVCAMFMGCKKDDNSEPSNSVTITGTFTIGDKTYTDPTFDLGEPESHEGYIVPNYKNLKVSVSNMIRIEPVEDVELATNIFTYYKYDVYTEAIGAAESYLYISIYNETVKQNLWIYCESATTTITKIDDVGGYIEGTFEGTFLPDKKSVVSYPVKGKFKVKHIIAPVEQ